MEFMKNKHKISDIISVVETISCMKKNNLFFRFKNKHLKTDKKATELKNKHLKADKNEKVKKNNEKRAP